MVYHQAIFNIKWRGNFPTSLPGIQQRVSVNMYGSCQLNETDTSNERIQSGSSAYIPDNIQGELF
jgi:hypothetical protein